MNNMQNPYYMMEGFENKKHKPIADIQGGSNVSASDNENEVFQPLVENFYDPNPPVHEIAKKAKNYVPPEPSIEPAREHTHKAPPQTTDEGFANYASVDYSEPLDPKAKKSQEFQSCFPRDRLTASDLLPKDAADSKWARLNPAGAGDIHDQNYLTAGYHIGVNTVGQSMRNANLQLRSEIPNPQTPVGPWMISTIEPDLRQNTLEIGSAPSY